MVTEKPKKHGFDAARLDRISVWMERYISERKFPGASVLIARGGDEVYSYATGQRDVEAQLPFERDTIVRLFSMSKPITSVATLMLAEKGLFHFDAPLSEFLPEFENCNALIPGASHVEQTEPCATPTIHQLLTHTSGMTYPFNPGLLARHMEEVGFSFNPDQGTLADMVTRASGLPLAFQPGSKWEYSVSIDILGRVIEVVSGQSLADFLQSEIFEPLEMHETGFSAPNDCGDRFASLYTPLEGDPMALNESQKGDETLRLCDESATSPFRNATMFSGGGGLCGTLDNYMNFAEMLRSGGARNGVRMLSPKTVQFMMRNHLSGDIASMGPESFAEQSMEGMGFGLGGAVVLDPARARTPGHVGDFSWGGMASTFFWVDQQADMSVVFLTQLSPSSSYPSRSELKALVHGAMIN